MTYRIVMNLIVSVGICSFVSASTQIIPFRISNGLMVIRAKVQGQSGNYIFDTGIPNMVLNARYFSKRSSFSSGYGSRPPMNGSSGHGGGYPIRMYLDDLTLWGHAAIVDLGLIEKSKRMPIHGMLGLHALKRYEVVLDYQKQEIQLYELTRKGDRKGANDLMIPHETVDLHFLEHIPYISAKVNGQDLLMGLDTGTELNVLSEKYLSTVEPKGGTYTHKKLLLLGSTSASAAPIGLTTTQVGHFKLPELETIFISLKHLNELSGPKIDGLVGLNFLRHFQITLNFKKKKISFRAIDNEESFASDSIPLPATGNCNNGEGLRNNDQQ